MGHYKTFGATNHLSASPEKKQNSSSSAIRADGDSPSRIEPARSAPNRLSFTEDFTLEHSGPCRQITLTGISGCF